MDERDGRRDDATGSDGNSMNDERLRALYARGTIARDARGDSEVPPPERLLALVRGELPEAERLELLDAVMASAAGREAFALLHAVHAAGRDAPTAADEAGGAPGGSARRGADVRPIDRPIEVVATRADDSSADARPLRVIAGGAPPARAVRGSSWWRSSGLAAAAVLVVAVGLVTRQRGAEREVMRGDQAGVRLIAPGTAAPATASPRFVWHAVHGATGYELELLDPADEPIYTATVADTVHVLPSGTSLRPGVTYHWMVRAGLPDGSVRSSEARSLQVGER